MKNKKYKFEISIILVLITLTVISLLFFNNITATSITNSNMKITFFDIGRADAILIEIESKAVIIDTGEDIHSEEIIGYLNENNITEIEYMILTHPDRDHIGGAADIIDNITINNLIESTLERDTKPYRRLREASNNNNIEPVFLREKMSFNINDVEFNIYPPFYDDYEKSNDFSLIVSVIHGDNTFLFTGDAEEIRLNEYLEQATNIEHDFLKVPHHGVYNEASFKFIESVNPTYAVITSTRNRLLNRDTQVIAWLDFYEVETYITGNGRITVLSDAKNIYIYQ